jgi:predicted nucleotidyltransferase
MKFKLELLETDLLQITSILSQDKNIKKALIFGSRAKGSFKKGGDVDLAIFVNSIDFEIVNKISYLLNEETNMSYKFDVLNYNTIKEETLKEHIDRVGIEIYIKKQKNEEPF